MIIGGNAETKEAEPFGLVLTLFEQNYTSGSIRPPIVELAMPKCEVNKDVRFFD